MELKGRKTLVLGAGQSGLTAARFLAVRGAVVAHHDKKPVGEWPEAAGALKEDLGVGLIDGAIPTWLLDQIDLVVISPGVPTGVIPATGVAKSCPSENPKSNAPKWPTPESTSTRFK